MIAPETSGELSTHLTIGAVIVYGIEWAKSSKLIPMDTDTKNLNRIVSALAAAGLAAGITGTYDSTSGDLVIKNIHLTTLGLFLWEWTKQFTFQQGFYDLLLNRKGQ